MNKFLLVLLILLLVINSVISGCSAGYTEKCTKKYILWGELQCKCVKTSQFIIIIIIIKRKNNNKKTSIIIIIITKRINKSLRNNH